MGAESVIEAVDASTFTAHVLQVREVNLDWYQPTWCGLETRPHPDAGFEDVRVASDGKAARFSVMDGDLCPRCLRAFDDDGLAVDEGSTA